MASFVHSALADPHKQIRLLRLLPGTGEDVLELEMEHYYLDEAPEYDAISYTWGDASFHRIVKINDSELEVRYNCCYALWQARIHNTTRWLWIDSICINQNDLMEKGTQVGIMGNVYGNAATVFACIGAHANDSRTVFSMTPEADHSWFSMGPSQMVAQMETTIDTLMDSVRQWAVWLTLQPRSQLARLFRAFYALQRRPYWSRLWILQEIALAKAVNILCGEDSLSWSRVRGLARIVLLYEISDSLKNTCPDLPRTQEHVVQDISYLVQSGANSHRLSKLLREACGRECLDGRDRIYSIAALVDWSHYKQPAVVPDYNKSATELALEVAKLLHFQDLGSLAKALGIRFDFMDLVSLVQERRRPVSSPTNISAVLCEPFSISYEAENMLRVCEIVTDKYGNLTAALKPKKDSLDDGANAKADSMQRLSEVIEHEVDTFRAHQIMVDSDVAAITCGDTRAGDFLVPCNYADSPGILFLVLRKHIDEIYDIVGQAFSLGRYIMCDVTKPQSLYCDCADGLRHDNLKASVLLHMSAEDALVLVAQDYVDETSFDPMARLRRLKTRACMTPGGAARLSNLRRWSRSAVEYFRDHDSDW